MSLRNQHALLIASQLQARVRVAFALLPYIRNGQYS